MINRLRANLSRFDWILFLSVLILIIISITTIWSVALARTPDNLGIVVKQTIAAFVGLCLMFFLAASNYRLLKNYNLLIFFIALMLLVSVLLFGQMIRGTRGWLTVAGWNFQPVEFAKFALIVFLSNYLAKHPRAAFGFGEFVLMTIFISMMVLLVLLQPDFGSALVLIAIWAGLLSFARIRKRYLLILFAAVVIAASAAWLFFAPYQRDRVLTFVDPSRDPLGRGYNVSQAIIAIGAGELVGRGLGFGSQSQLRFLPESQTDFIFAVIAENFGFIGLSVILIFLGLIIWRLMAIAKLSRDDFTVFLTLGILIVFVTQTVVNIGMNLGLLPVAGLTLPLLSYGGSSLLMMLVMLGVVQSIAVRRPLSSITQSIDGN